MKRPLSFFLAAFSSTALFGETIRIGTMDLPLLFEGEPPTGAVHEFATNEIARYYHSVVGFLGLSPNAPQPADINKETAATMIWKSPVFEGPTRFSVESGNTNCVVSVAFVANAAAVLPERNERAALAASAEVFLQSMSSGSITNLPAAELRSKSRIVSTDGNGLVPVPESEQTDVELRDMFSRIAATWVFEPLCLMELTRQPLGTNEVWLLPVRVDEPSEPSHSRMIFPVRLVYFGGYWSLLN